MSLDNEIKLMIEDIDKNDIQALEEKYVTYFHKPIVTQDFHGIKGLFYIQNYLTSSETNMIQAKISNEINLEPISKKPNSRRVAHYGYYYSYNKTGLTPAPQIPHYLEKIVNEKRINNLLGFNLIKIPFEQVIINEYKPGQEINYHTDHKILFGPIIVCITVGQAVPIHFKLDNEVKIINVAANSMYIMTDEARNLWKHYLKNNNDKNRYSITYRTIKK